MNGNEVQEILLNNKVNLTWLAKKLGITPQGLNSRFKASDFKQGYLMEITDILGRDLFGINAEQQKQPILDINTCAGMGVELECKDNKIIEYVSIPCFNGCIGITIYGENMCPKYIPGDIVFVRRIYNKQDIDFGNPYLIITQEDRLLRIICEYKHGNDILCLSSYNMQKNGVGDRLYPDRNIRISDMQFLYKVTGHLSRMQI